MKLVLGQKDMYLRDLMPKTLNVKMTHSETHFRIKKLIRGRAEVRT